MIARSIDALGFDFGDRALHEGGADTCALVSEVDGDHVDLARPTQTSFAGVLQAALTALA